jgi:hypothetical protein
MVVALWAFRKSHPAGGGSRVIMADSGHGPLIETLRGLLAHTDRNAPIVS